MSTDTKEIAAPTIHLNGTSGEQLAEMYELAAKSLYAALVQLHEASPNGRDYADNGGRFPFVVARDQHNDRILKLRDILAEITTIRESIADQLDARSGNA